MTRPRLPIRSSTVFQGRRGGVRGTGAASGSPPDELAFVLESGTAADIESQTPMEPPWLLDSREVARLLGIGRTKAFELMSRFELPTIRIGRSVRVSRNDLRRWIDDQLAPTAGFRNSSSGR